MAKVKVISTPKYSLELNQDELDLLYQLTRHVGGTGPVRAWVDKLSSKLGNIGARDYLDEEESYFKATKEYNGINANSEKEAPSDA